MPVHTNRRIAIVLNPLKSNWLWLPVVFKPSQIESSHKQAAWLCRLSSCQFTQTACLPVSYLAQIELASGCQLPVVLNRLPVSLAKTLSNWHLAASCQLPIHTNRRISIWLPFAGFAFLAFIVLNPNWHLQMRIASGCQLLLLLAFIVLNPLKSNWHLAASCQLPIHTNRRISIWLPFAGFLSSFYCFKPSQSPIGTGKQFELHLAAVASCQFTQTGELASGCRLPVSYLAFIVLNPLKSNWHLAASCQLPIHTNRRISIWLPFAGFLSSFYCFKPSQIELASGCQLPVANSHKQAN